jgi:hypothetical protein
MSRATVSGIGVLLLMSGVVAGTALGTPQMLGEAKKAGFPANNCQYCHTQALPKKETFKADELNDRGKFLMADMKQRSLKAPDVGKLKEYKDTK